MAYDDRPMYEINADEKPLKKPRIPWVDQVLGKTSSQPRDKRVSSLLEDWIDKHESGKDL
jgi:hypothetical protein